MEKPALPPGRPTVSDVRTKSSNIAEFIDYYINKHARDLPSFVKDSFDFVQKIKNVRLEKNDIFIVGDVNSLYTNMNLNRTVAIIRRLFKRYPDTGRPDKQSRNVTQNVTSNQLHQQPRPPLLPTLFLPTPTTDMAMWNPGNYTITNNKVAQPLMEGTTTVRDPRSIRKRNDNIKALKRSANNASLDKHRAKKTY